MEVSRKVGGKLFLILLFVNAASFCMATDGTLVIQDCTGCTSLTSGYQYESFAIPADPDNTYSLYHDNWNCDIEVNHSFTIGDIDDEWDQPQSGIMLDGCDGEEDDATLNYTSARSNSWELSGKASWSVMESLGIELGFEITQTSESGTALTKPVSCPACQTGSVTPTELRKHLDVTVTMTADQTYDENVWRTTMEWWMPPLPFPQIPILIRVKHELNRTTPKSIDCGSDDAYWAEVGYNYYMSFPEDFEACPLDENGCPCVVL